VDDTGCARLTDFGLAGIISDSGSTASITDSHAVRWAALEILDMEGPVSKESDVFSLSNEIVKTKTLKPVLELESQVDGAAAISSSGSNTMRYQYLNTSI